LLDTVYLTFLIHRYKALSVHYVSPTEDNQYQTQKMKEQGLYSDVHDEVGGIIVAEVNAESILRLVQEDGKAMEDLIHKR
jgi:isocitrate lyase